MTPLNLLIETPLNLLMNLTVQWEVNRASKVCSKTEYIYTIYLLVI